MRYLSWLGASLLALLAVFACEKDPDINTSQPIIDQQMKMYESFAPKLEKGISVAIMNEAFKGAVIAATKPQKMGDTEALLRDILAREEGTVKNILEDAGNSWFTPQELDDFLVEYPSMIIGVRGSYSSWENEQHLPAVAYVPVNFNEKSTSIKGSRSGEAITIALDQPFTDAVLAIRLSERHDRSGKPVRFAESYNPRPVGWKSGDRDTREGTDDGNDNSEKDTRNEGDEGCITEEACAALNIVAFSAVPEEGCIQLSYTIANPPLICERYLRVEIDRLNPDGSITKIVRTGHAEESFRDCHINPGVTYFYMIQVTVRLPHEAASIIHDLEGNIYATRPSDFPECPFVSFPSVLTVEAPEFGDRLDSFVGQNFNNETIYYTWEPPSTGGWQYRLSYWNGLEYVEEAILPDPTQDPSDFETAYLFNHPISDRGQLVRMKIQYRPNGQAHWQGDFYDETYASHHNSEESLFFYGMELPNVDLLEQGVESPINGNPEFRLIAVRGLSSGTDEPRSDVFRQIFTLTERCPGTDFFHPINGPLHIVDWDNDLFGSAITCHLYETDESEVRIDGLTVENTIAKDFNAQVGVKFFIGDDGTSNGDQNPGNGNNGSSGINLGISTTHRDVTKQTIDFPIFDVELGVDIIYYHEERTRARGNRYYGVEDENAEQTVCDILADF